MKKVYYTPNQFKLTSIVNEIFLEKKIKNLLEEYHKVFSEAEENTSKDSFDTLVKQVASTGANIKGQEVQLDLLDKLIDTGFEPEKVDPEQITEYNLSINEDGGVVGLGISALEHADVIEQVAHILQVDIAPVKKAVTFLKKIAEWPFKIIKKFFFKIARIFGASIETAEKVGITGLGAIALICIVFGIIHFPALIALLSGSFGLIALAKIGYALVKAASGVSALWNHWKKYNKEHANVIYTTNDFLTDIEKKYKEYTNKKIPTNWVFDLKEWHDEIEHNVKDQTIKEKIDKWLKSVVSDFNANKKANNINDLIRIAEKYTPNNKNVVEIFKQIQTVSNTNKLAST